MTLKLFRKFIQPPMKHRRNHIGFIGYVGVKGLNGLVVVEEPDTVGGTIKPESFLYFRR